MIPEAKILPRRTKRNSCQPRNDPTAPISFQSPAPNARRLTSGSKRISARPLPSREKSKPCQPFSTRCSVTPERTPGTVSQLGMRRERQSSNAAETVNASVRIQMICAACMRKWFLQIGSIDRVAVATFPRKLRGGHVGGGLVENTINCACQCSQRRDCCQGEQDQQECVLCQVLAFL